MGSSSKHSCKRLRLDEPWHGNVLLSCGPHKLEPKQQLQEFNADFVPWYEGCWFVFVDAPGNLICRQTVCAALVATSAHTLEERRCFQNQRGRLSPCSQVFANYSWLSSGPPINIAATELRGITIEQLSSLQLRLHQHTAWQMPRQFCFFLFSRSLVSKGSEKAGTHHVT